MIQGWAGWRDKEAKECATLEGCKIAEHNGHLAERVRLQCAPDPQSVRLCTRCRERFRKGWPPPQGGRWGLVGGGNKVRPLQGGGGWGGFFPGFHCPGPWPGPHKILTRLSSYPFPFPRAPGPEDRAFVSGNYKVPQHPAPRPGANLI